MTDSLSLSELSSLFRSELAAYYSGDEIRTFNYLIAEHLLNYSKIDFHLNSRETISPKVVKKYLDILTRLKAWEPIQYVLGETEFYGFRLKTDRRALIPRPETEELVDVVIKRETGRKISILDIGTGSGCIAVALAGRLPLAELHACDADPQALDLALSNATFNHCAVRFFRCDILSDDLPMGEGCDVIVSNPPYVTHSEKKLMRRNVLDYEPPEALFVPDEDPLLYYRYIAAAGCSMLPAGGRLYVEINENFHEMLMDLLKNMAYKDIELRYDLNLRPRIMIAYR